MSKTKICYICGRDCSQYPQLNTTIDGQCLCDKCFSRIRYESELRRARA